MDRRFLAPLVEGPRLAAFGLSEPDNGSDAAAMSTRARFEGDEIVLDGRKMWISNGGFADVYIRNLGSESVNVVVDNNYIGGTGTDQKLGVLIESWGNSFTTATITNNEFVGAGNDQAFGRTVNK